MAWAMRQRSVSLPRSSNRTGGFPASGFPIGFTIEHTDKKIGCKRLLRSMFPVLHSLIQQPPTGPVVDGVARLIANHRDLSILGSTPKVRVLSSAGITRPQRSYDPVRLPSEPPPESDVEAATLVRSGPPRMTRPTFPTCRAQYPDGPGRVRASVASPSHAAFPVMEAGRHPHIDFRDLLRLHSRYGPLNCSTAQGGLCHEAPAQPVTQPNRSSATGANRQLSGWLLPPLVTRALGAHSTTFRYRNVKFVRC